MEAFRWLVRIIFIVAIVLVLSGQNQAFAQTEAPFPPLLFLEIFADNTIPSIPFIDTVYLFERIHYFGAGCPTQIAPGCTIVVRWTTGMMDTFHILDEHTVDVDSVRDWDMNHFWSPNDEQKLRFRSRPDSSAAFLYIVLRRGQIIKPSQDSCKTIILKFRRYCPVCPSMTEWGLLILESLLIGSAIFILLKRRITTASEER